jgi:hypothetical protein
MSAREVATPDLTPTEARDLRRLVGIMIPASTEYAAPGADDEMIFADIVRSLGRDAAAVRTALALLREIADGDFCTLDDCAAEAAAMTLLGRGGPVMMALGRSVLQCYYRDERVLRGLGIDPVAPFPKGRPLEQGDWSLLDAVRGRPPIWRDDRKAGD